MGRMSSFEAKTHFGKLLSRVLQGEEVIITRHDRPVARVTAAEIGTRPGAERAIRGLQALQQQIRQRTRSRLSVREVRAAIAAGRK